MWFPELTSHNITSGGRPPAGGREVLNRCELLSDSAGGLVCPRGSVAESKTSPVVSLTLYSAPEPQPHLRLVSLDITTVVRPIYVPG